MKEQAAANRYIGSPVRRVEDLRFLRGHGEYVGDLRRDRLLHAAVLRSPVAHGRIRAIDTRAAAALPGVHAILTAADFAGRVPSIPLRLQALPELEPFQQPVIAEAKVRYVGEPLALVVAASEPLAEDARQVIEFDIEPLPAVVDRSQAATGEVLLFEAAGTNLAITLTAHRGAGEAAFDAAPYRRRECFGVHRHTAVPMETRGLLAEWDAARGRLIVSGAAKVPFFIRRVLARLMGLAEDSIEMVENDVGGGFGVRGEFYPEDFLIPFAARRLGRPVQWIEDRREHLVATNHAREIDCELEIACARDGTILGLRGRIHIDQGAYVRTTALSPATNVLQVLSGPYRIPDIHVDCAMLLTNKTPVGTYRAPGRFESSFFCERLIDLVAADLGIDRVEFRRRNLVAAAEMPYALATVSPYGNETQLDSGDYRVVFERCLREFDWPAKSALAGKLIEGRHHGIAVSCYIEGGGTGPKEDARLVLGADGRVAVFIGSSSVGQGVETVFGQIAADALQISMDRIAGVFHGSTAYVRDGGGSFSSRSVVMAGSAIVAAAEKLRAAIRAAAAGRLGCEPAAVQIVDDRAVAPGGRSVAWAALATPRLAVEATFTSSKRTYSYGVHAAQVAVDAATGAVEVVDYVAVEDVGRIINPLTLHGQVVGAIVQGLGGVFLEHLVYDAAGQPLAVSLADYLLPTASDFPRIRSISLELCPSPNNPLGAKGAGEGGIIPVGGLMANAVASALASLGVDPRTLPLSPPRLWRLIAAARR